MTGEEWLTSGAPPPVHIVPPPESEPPALTDSDDEESVSSRMASERMDDGDDEQPYDPSWKCLDAQVAWITGDQPSRQISPQEQMAWINGSDWNVLQAPKTKIELANILSVVQTTHHS